MLIWKEFLATKYCPLFHFQKQTTGNLFLWLQWEEYKCVYMASSRNSKELLIIFELEILASFQNFLKQLISFNKFYNKLRMSRTSFLHRHVYSPISLSLILLIRHSIEINCYYRTIKNLNQFLDSFKNCKLDLLAACFYSSIYCAFCFCEYYIKKVVYQCFYISKE